MIVGTTKIIIDLGRIENHLRLINISYRYRGRVVRNQIQKKTIKVLPIGSEILLIDLEIKKHQNKIDIK